MCVGCSNETNNSSQTAQKEKDEEILPAANKAKAQKLLDNLEFKLQSAKTLSFTQVSHFQARLDANSYIDYLTKLDSKLVSGEKALNVGTMSTTTFANNEQKTEETDVYSYYLIDDGVVKIYTLDGTGEYHGEETWNFSEDTDITSVSPYALFSKYFDYEIIGYEERDGLSFIALKAPGAFESKTSEFTQDDAISDFLTAMSFDSKGNVVEIYEELQNSVSVTTSFTSLEASVIVSQFTNFTFNEELEFDIKDDISNDLSGVKPLQYIKNEKPVEVTNLYPELSTSPTVKINTANPLHYEDTFSITVDAAEFTNEVVDSSHTYTRYFTPKLNVLAATYVTVSTSILDSPDLFNESLFDLISDQMFLTTDCELNVIKSTANHITATTTSPTTKNFYRITDLIYRDGTVYVIDTLTMAESNNDSIPADEAYSDLVKASECVSNSIYSPYSQ